jgi:methyl acetate hydrolase
MNDISALLAAAVAAGDAPFLVAMAGTASGILHEGAAGEAMPGTPASPDTVFRIFSQTKAIGAVAAMILIERGQLRFDTPVRAVLPEFAELPVLEGFDGDEPRLRPQRGECTIAHLASHTSGLAYEYWNPNIARWMEVSGHPSVFSGKIAGLHYPLVSDPGTEWHYGPGVDWLGRVVEAVDGRRIDAYCRAEIFEPLGMADTRFDLESDLEDQLSQAWSRREDGFKPARSGPAPHPEFYGMGHALYSTAPDYMRFLRMVLNGGTLDGNRILSSAGIQAMLATRSGGLSVPRLRSVAPRVSQDFDPFPGRRVTHSMAWARLEEDVPGRRAAGSQHWAGALNTHCWLDPKSGIAGLFMTQLAPWSDAGFMRAYEAYERAVYQVASKS